MIMIKTRNLDELQLLKRGNVFKHGLSILVGLLLVNALLYSCGIDWASGKWAELTIILFTVVFCNIEFICYDIYPLTERRQRFLFYFFGLFGTVSIAVCVYDLINEQTGIIVDEKIVSSALGIVYGVMFLAVFFTYICRAQYKARHEKDE
ncbi:MAG: hypothetical protein FWG14_08320 [Peptococcaceae bacterium]|nr:hypothetical protein [Peptococcaceae bacterium]